MNTVVDLQPLLDIFLQLLAAVLMALASWAAAWIVRKLKLSSDGEVRAYLDQALRNGVAVAIEAARQKGASLAAVDVRKKVVADAMTYAMARVPDALNHFGIDEYSLSRMVAARLPAPEPESKATP